VCEICAIAISPDVCEISIFPDVCESEIAISPDVCGISISPDVCEINPHEPLGPTTMSVLLAVCLTQGWGRKDRVALRHPPTPL
jgi:hypothetical protein